MGIKKAKKGDKKKVLLHTVEYLYKNSVITLEEKQAFQARINEKHK